MILIQIDDFSIVLVVFDSDRRFSDCIRPWLLTQAAVFPIVLSHGFDSGRRFFDCSGSWCLIQIVDFPIVLGDGV